MKEPRRGFFFVSSVTLAGVIGLSLLSFAVAQEEPPDKDAFRSAPLLTTDQTVTSPGPSSRTGIGPPPRVGPNNRVNDAQQPFPNGLLGRSETSVAALNGGQFIVAGWND